MPNCELRGCKSEGPEKISVGRFQVYDNELKMPTLDRPAYMCKRCVQFARQCSLSPIRE